MMRKLEGGKVPLLRSHYYYLELFENFEDQNNECDNPEQNPVQ